MDLPSRFGGAARGALSSTPGQGTRSHMPQWKIPHATTKTQHSHINKITWTAFLKSVRVPAPEILT